MSAEQIDPRDVVISAGRQRLLTDGIDALRGLLNASVLSKDIPVSRDTAYRVFRSARGDDESVADAIVGAVAEAAHDLAWAGTAEAQAAAIEAYAANVSAGSDHRTTVVDALRATFEAQFRSPGLAAAWLLQSAALTASEAWEGEPPAAENVELGRRILGLRRDFYRNMEEQLEGFVALAGSEMGQRPRRGIDAATVVRVLHCFLDGAVLRRIIDPEAMPPELAAEGLYALAKAFGEAGPADDPRKPDDERSHELFRRLLDAATELWRTGAGVTVEQAAERSAVGADAAHMLFPDVGDLADSVLRSRVIMGGFVDLGPFPDRARALQHLPALASELGRLRDLADEVPHVVATAAAHPPTRSKPFADDFVDNESRAIELLGVTHRPEQLVRDLFDFAAQGAAGWPSVAALLRTTGYES
jgi:hypothetical protein